MKPIAVSMGDPAGIGLELAARAWGQRLELPPFFVVGDPGAVTRALERVGRAPCVQVVFDARAAAAAGADTLAVLAPPTCVLAAPETPGAPDPANGPAIIDAIAKGVDAVRAGHASALVTLPIAKSVLREAGFGFPGHTEFVAHLTKDDAWAHARGPVMLLAGPTLKVALATIHTPLARVAEELTRERVMHVARVLGEALKRDFGVSAPRMALCGLNPHAGEGGHLGREELDVLNPAAAALRAEGWDIADARSADTMFNAEVRSGYDAAIALYHDQGLIPVKTLHFWDAVNVTLGLPIVRTSPDHGTGFDIAGKGMARSDSFHTALRMAHDMAARRARAP